MSALTGDRVRDELSMALLEADSRVDSCSRSLLLHIEHGYGLPKVRGKLHELREVLAHRAVLQHLMRAADEIDRAAVPK